MATGLLVERLLMVFLGPLLDEPGQSAFMPVFSYYVLLYITIVVLLPYPVSAMAGTGAWLLMAVLTTLLSLPRWFAPQTPPMLGALLIYVWLGHGTLVVLIFSAARMQARLVEAQAAAVLNDPAPMDAVSKDVDVPAIVRSLPQVNAGLVAKGAPGHVMASDNAQARGLRAPSGRRRAAERSVRDAVRQLRESIAG